MKSLILALLLCYVAVGQDSTATGQTQSLPFEARPGTLRSKPEPMNVPAIKIWKRGEKCRGDYSGHEYDKAQYGSIAQICRDGGTMVWTCPDESWELHTSVNGKVHWCSRPPVMEKP